MVIERWVRLGGGDRQQLVLSCAGPALGRQPPCHSANGRVCTCSPAWSLCRIAQAQRRLAAASAVPRCAAVYKVVLSRAMIAARGGGGQEGKAAFRFPSSWDKLPAAA
jgi:hypothetical protein